jgi:predicted GTPase
MNKHAKTADSLDVWTRHSDLLEQLRALIQAIQKIDLGMLEDLDLLQMVQNWNNNVTLTFGGCFSSGKSTLINALLRRSLLPTAKIPETGTLCRIQAGVEDKAEVISQAGSRSIPFTTEAIAAYVSLIDRATGESKAQVLGTKEIRLQVTHSNIPKGQIILDSPGIDDSGVMDARAAQAASRSDVLVWILRSNHILSESEQDFLATYIARRGPHQLIFVLNAYLDEDTAEAWHEFHNSELQPYLNKIRDFCVEHQLPVKKVVVISARAFAKYDILEFGGMQLVNLLLNYSHPTKTAVLLARISRFQHGLMLLQQRLEQRLAEEMMAYETAKTRAEIAAKTRLDKIQKSLNAVQRAAKFQMDSWLSQRALEKATEDLAETITSETLNREGQHSEDVNQAFRHQVEKGVEKIVTAIVSTTQREQIRCDTNRLRQALLKQVKPASVTIDVPNTDVSGSALAVGAAAGAAAGAWFFGIGAVPGAIIGTILASAASSSDAVAQDVQATQLHIREAGRVAQDAVETASRHLDAIVAAHCQTTIPDVAIPDDTQVCLLRELLTTTSSLKQEVDCLLEGIPV